MQIMTDTIAGSELYIGGRMSPLHYTLTETDFTGQAWVEIGGIASLGQVGNEQDTGGTTMIRSSFDRRLKTVRRGVLMENSLVPMATDQGQIALQEASQQCENRAFLLRMPGCDGVWSGFMFMGLVLDGTWPGGDGAAVSLISAPVQVNSNIVPFIWDGPIPLMFFNGQPGFWAGPFIP